MRTIIEAASASSTAASDWLTPEKVSVYAILMLIIVAFYRRWIVTGKQHAADREADKVAYALKDEAHAQIVANKDEQIATLKEQLFDAHKVNRRRESQLHLVLSEIAPSLVAWTKATQTVVMEITDGSSGDDGDANLQS